MRERFGSEAFLIGFSTWSGTVTAARDWDGPAERRRVRPGLRGSYEELFHAVGLAEFWLDLAASLRQSFSRQPQPGYGCRLVRHRVNAPNPSELMSFRRAASGTRRARGRAA